MTQKIKTPAASNTVSDWQRIVYTTFAVTAALILAIIYYLADGSLVQDFDNYARNLLKNSSPHLYGVSGAFLFLMTMFQMLAAASMASALADKTPGANPQNSIFFGGCIQIMALMVFAVAGFMEGIVISPHIFEGFLSTGQIFAMAVTGGIALPVLAFLFGNLVCSMWEHPYSALTHLGSFSLFGIATIVAPTMDIVFAVLSLGLVAMSAFLLPLGFKFRCACDGVTDNWQYYYRRYDPIG